MVNVAQGKFEQLVGKDTSSIGKSKQTMIGKDSSQAHGASMQYPLMTQAAQTGVSVNNLNAFSNDDIAEDWKEGEDGREGGLAVNDEEGNVVDLQSVCEISDSSAAFVGMGDDDNFVASINEFLEWC